MRNIFYIILIALLCVFFVGCNDHSESANSKNSSGNYTASKNVIHDIVRNPTDMPAPVGKRGPKHITVNLVAKYLLGRLNTDTTYVYWTYNGKVPGPMIRARVGDTITINLKNPKANASSFMTMTESLDFHAVIGPGGGATLMRVDPGETKSITFKAQRPGLFIYHCAMKPMAEHLANGMYGMVVIVPPGGLPKVDHEYYISQNEVYTLGSYGQRGRQSFDSRKLFASNPTYYVYNGAVGSLTKKYPMKAKVGDSVRIFFVNAGPDKSSAFHIIGQIMDKVYPWGSLSNPPLKNISVITVPPGGTLLTEFKFQQPGTYQLIDHHMLRMAIQLEGDFIVTGKPNGALLNAGRHLRIAKNKK